MYLKDTYGRFWVPRELAKQIIKENYLIVLLNVDKRLLAVTQISHKVKIISSFLFTLVDISDSKIEINHKTKTSNQYFVS